MLGLKTSIKIIHFIFWHCEKLVLWAEQTKHVNILYEPTTHSQYCTWHMPERFEHTEDSLHCPCFPTLSLLPHHPLITSLSFLNILDLIYKTPVFSLGKLGVVLVHLGNSADFQKNFWNVLLCLSLIKVDKFLTESIKKIYRLPILNKWSCIQCECWCCCNCCS